MSTTQVTAGQVMDRVANLLNDPNKTDYTYAVQIPYLNMAIEEFSDLMAEANAPLTNLSSFHMAVAPIVVPAGLNYIVYPEYEQPGVPSSHWPRYHPDMIEIQEVLERPHVQKVAPPPPPVGGQGLWAEDAAYGTYRKLPRKEWCEVLPRTNSLQYWVYEASFIRFNPATIDMEVVINYIYQGVPYVANENSLINMVGSRTYLAYKTAAFCAMFIGENESRAAVLEGEAMKAVDRAIAIGNKGKQQIVTRHRPFRAAWKARGGF
jgi:hypothetical protein